MAALEQLLSAEDIAEATGLHYQTVLEQIRGGDLHALKIGNRWKIKPADYDAWLESKRAQPRVPERPNTRVRKLRPRGGSGPGSLARLAEIERQRP